MKKVEYVKGTLNCAETIIDAYNKNNGDNIPVAIGSGMGTGLTVGGVCGAINAAAVVIGMKKGRETAEEANEARALVNDFMKRIKEKYGDENCIYLKKSGVSCQDIVAHVYEELEATLNQN